MWHTLLEWRRLGPLSENWGIPFFSSMGEEWRMEVVALRWW